jgi:lysophospholipase L1-like esterase
MRRFRSLTASAIAAAVLGSPALASAKIKVAAVGASTTAGSGSTAGHSYPDELQRELGAEYEVKNFGVGGTTLLRKGDRSYWDTSEFKAALAYQPDIALIWFGGNDSKAENWTPYKGEFLGDYLSMIRMFQGLPSRARTFVSISCVIKDSGEIRKAVVDNEIAPLVRQAGAETGSVVIDLRAQFERFPQYFQSDGIHPNNMGTAAIAKYVRGVLLASLADAGAPGPAADAGASSLDAAAAAPDAGATPAPDAATTRSADAGPRPPAARLDAAPAPGADPDPDPEPAPARTASKSGGCSLALAAPSSGPGALLLALAALAVAARRRSRR